MKKKNLLVCVVIGIGCVIVVLVGQDSFFVTKQEKNVLVVYGNVDIREVDLGFRVFGKVKSLFFEEGDRVEQGVLLAELDAIPYIEKLQEAQAQVTYAEISLAKARQQLKRREEAIVSSSISQENFQNAVASVQELEAVVERALATFSSAQTACEDTKLLAPCEGTLLSRIREPGSVLNPGVPVYTLSLDSPIWVRAYVSEMDLGKVFPGMKASIVTDNVGGPVYEGQVGFISPVAEFTPKNVETAALRTELVYRIRIVIEHPDLGLRQGMPVTVKLSYKTEKL